MKKRFLKYFSLGMVLTSVFVSSCRKDDFVDGDAQETQTSGNTIIKIIDGPEKSLFLDAATGIAPVNVFNIRRDAANAAALNTASSVTLTAAPDLIAAYNTAHPISTGVPNTYETLPESLYTPGAGLTKTSTGYTIALNAGDFAKDFRINLNFGLFDFSKKYALAYKITNPGNGTTSANQGQIFVLISVKNAYDGIYSQSGGYIQRYTAPGVKEVGTLSGTLAGNPDLTLTTINATTVEIGNLTWFGGTGGVGGIANLRATIDPATNLVTMSCLGAPTLKNTAGAVNKYDPATKTFTLNFDWNPVTTPRVVSDLVIKYKGSR
ncbi:DUF1735 domain-containing protein [Pedobacter rhodius]|uniref:DUF1735 domain-containing protein n=1 Tax=Pedobacter rhodius TaxID=3004098 RepID=A0ABT4KYM4_9SPHI|nr:DUF1735 domain-containing protein [Pedobacter sp. SJ11]MCZ4224019.1 DUF1735 domain-containing protein [Pedobacter sp. SJ11]